MFTVMRRDEFEERKKQMLNIDLLDMKSWEMSNSEETYNKKGPGLNDKWIRSESTLFIDGGSVNGETSYRSCLYILEERNKEGRESVLVIGQSEAELQLFRIRMNISYALHILKDYHSNIPQYSGSYEGGNISTFLADIYEWQYKNRPWSGIEVGRVLSKIPAENFYHSCIHNYQRDIGDYYASIGRNDLALIWYIHGCRNVAGSNYSYLIKWGLQFRIVETLMAGLRVDESQKSAEDGEYALMILNQLLENVQDLHFLEEAEDTRQKAMLLKAIVLARLGETEEGRIIIEGENGKILLEEINIHKLFILLHLLGVFGADTIGRKLLNFIAEQSDSFQKLTFMENENAWLFGEDNRFGSWDVEELRPALVNSLAAL